MSAQDTRYVVDEPVNKNWRGIALPITRDSGDHWKSKTTLDLIWSSIILILHTRVGTRIMLPRFGSQLMDLVFEPNDEVLQVQAQHYIVDAIGMWEPRVTVDVVDIVVRENDFQARMIFTVRGFIEDVEGQFTVYRNQPFKIAQNSWRII